MVLPEYLNAQADLGAVLVVVKAMSVRVWIWFALCWAGMTAAG